MSQGQSMSQIEAEIEQARDRLAETVDQLAFRVSPQELARRRKESLANSFRHATRDEDGSLRIERIAAAVGAVVVVVVGIGLLRRRRG